MTKIRTDLELKADVSSLKRAGQEIKRTFSPDQINKFSTKSKELEKQLGKLTKAQIGLTNAMRGVKEGSERYEKLQKVLKTVRSETDLVTRSLSQLDRLMQRSSREQRNLDRQQQSDARRQQGGGFRNFGAGLAQSMGVAQFIPSGPGMGARIAGGLVGGGIRRAGGIAASPFLTPGIGGLAQGLSGIPLVGGFAAGSLQSAAASYQSAAGFAQARKQNLYFANEQIGQNRGTRRNAEYDRVLMRSAMARDELAGLSTPTSAQIKEAESVVTKKQQATDLTIAADRGFGGTAMRGISRPLQAAIVKSGKQTLSGRRSKAAKAVAAADMALAETQKDLSLGVDSGFGQRGLGVKFGFDPTQEEGMRGQFFGARGGMFRRNIWNEAMANQIQYGIGFQQSGQFARAGMAGGGGTGGGAGALTAFMRGGQAQGLQGSQIQEYLKTLVELQSKAESQGIKIDAKEFTKSSMQMKAVGFEGLQGQRVAGGMIGALQGLSGRGVSSPIDMALMRAAGYTGEGGSEEHFRIKAQMEHPDQKMISKVLGTIATGVQGVEGEYTQAGIAKMFFGQMGVNVGSDQAMKMISNIKNGKPPGIEDLLNRQKTLNQQSIVDQATGTIGKGGAGITVGAAALQNQRIGVGMGSAKWVQALEANSISMGKTMNNFGKDIEKLAGFTARALNAVNKIANGGVDGILGKLMTALGVQGKPVVVPKITKAAG